MELLLLLMFQILDISRAWSVPSSRLFAFPESLRGNPSHLSHGNGYLKELLERDETVTAALHFIEPPVNRSDPFHCVRKSLTQIRYQISERSYSLFRKQAVTAVKTANFLTNLFLRPPNDTLQVTYEDRLYYPLAEVNVLSDPLIYGSGLAFQRDVSGLFYPFAMRKGHKVITKDIALGYNFSYDDEGGVGTEWFWKQATKNISEVFGDRNGSWEGDLTVTLEDGVWTEPYLDCGGMDIWVVTFSAPFFTRRNGSLEFRGVATISIDLHHVGLDQCSTGNSLFADTHKCHRESTQCIPEMGRGFRRGAYRCHCRDGFYYPLGANESLEDSYFSGLEVEAAFVRHVLQQEVAGQSYPDTYRCRPCRRGCKTCLSNVPCFAQTNMLLRSIILGLQSFSTTITAVLGVVVFRLRKSKTIANAMWIMLEMVLVGAILVYQTVIIRYFEPSVLTCVVEPWFRELGFAVCYGAILLKIYRILAEFQTRKAHRVLVRDKDLLKYLLGIVLVVVGYMAAWTAVVMESIQEGHSVLGEGRTPEGLRYAVCKALWWDYITETGEILFLLLGIYLTYCIRNAKGDCYKEKCTLCWAVYIEFLFSLLLYSARHIVWLSMEPDHVFFLYFLRCQTTISVVLILIFSPKLWYHHRPPDPLENHRNRHLSSCDVHDHMPEAMKLHDAIMSNGELDFSEINLADMDPDDIRTELRRVYTQLQILRNKTMRKDNPHISKRRGGRKVTHRRFSLQPFHHKHKQQHDHDHEFTEVSKTPEESTASVEGTTTVPAQDGPTNTTTAATTTTTATTTTSTTSTLTTTQPTALAVTTPVKNDQELPHLTNLTSTVAIAASTKHRV